MNFTHVVCSSPYLRFIKKNFLGSGWLPDVPHTDDCLAVKLNSTGFGRRRMNRQKSLSLDLRELQQTHLATCKKVDMHVYVIEGLHIFTTIINTVCSSYLLMLITKCDV